MDMFDKMLVDYSEGEGSAFEEAQKSATNLTGSINTLTNSWNEFINTIVQSDDLKFLVNTLNGLIQGVTDLIKPLGTLGTIGFGAGTILSAKGLGLTKLCYIS